MPLAAGTKLGPYEVLSPLGAGGMGEVYRARDTRLGRDVALKVLPAAMAHDVERMARFQREAQVLASLNHPNIAAIYGLEESSHVRALVMELVEGPTLAERIGAVGAGLVPVPQTRERPQGAPLQFDECLHIAKQIAEALEYAHERGIVHRDLKPANVKSTPEGAVKILDFGLAKALEGERASSDVSSSPTITGLATQGGVIRGTAAYMSPEQARGKPVDKRADIWAFGVVLLEMLTGRQPFSGETVSDTLAAVITKEPDWEVLSPSTLPRIEQLLRRCLTKDPKQRLQAIGEARIAIENALADKDDLTPTAVRTPVEQPPFWRRAWTLGAGGLMLGAVMAGLLLQLQKPQAPPRPVARFAIALPPGPPNSSTYTPEIALSPDGTRLVYSVAQGGKTQLYLRPLDQFEARPIEGTEGATGPFFSPDGEWLGFFADGNLKKVALAGGPVQTLCSAPLSWRGNAGSWSSDGTIVFQAGDVLFQVGADGRNCGSLASPDLAQGQLAMGWPAILPGGGSLLFNVYRGFNFDTSGIAVLSVKTRKWQSLGQDGTNPHYLPEGYLVHAHAGSLLAAGFDLAHLRVTSSPAPVLDGVLTDEWTGNARFAISRDGTLAYLTGGLAKAARQVVLVDPHGTSQVLTQNQDAYEDLALSPDGRRVALTIEGTHWAIWIYDLPRGTLTRLTFEYDNGDPCWTPDGKRVIYTSFRNGQFGLYWMPVDGSGPDEQLLSSKSWVLTPTVSPDGKELAYLGGSAEGSSQIKILPLEGNRQPLTFLSGNFHVFAPEFSPDGRWLAYESDESGRPEVYVQQYPGPGGKWPISNAGGERPVWSRDGRQIFYRNGDKLMAVSVESKPGFSAGVPRLLFQGTYLVSYHYYDVMPDGKQFLFIKELEQPRENPQINVVLNWSDELKQRMGAGAKK
jgi:serine/threonine-protein kinase